MIGSFYFFHMDKTMGLSLEVNLMDQVYTMLDKGKIDISLNKEHRDHNFWREFDDSTYVFSEFRDPVKRLVSEFCYTMLYDQFHMYRTTDVLVKANAYNITLDNFEKWLYTVSTRNYQSRCVSGGLHDPHLASTRLSKINLLIRVEDLDIEANQVKLVNLISKQVGLGEKREIVPTYYEGGWFNHASIEFVINLMTNSKELLKDLEAMNSIDMDIYNRDSLFPSSLSRCLNLG